MSTVYSYIRQVIVVETGMPGAGPLYVGMGNDLGEALDNLESTPFGCHENEIQGIEWAVEASEEDLEEYDPEYSELAKLDDDQWEVYTRLFGADKGLRECEDLEYDLAETWYGCLGYHTEDDKGNQATHPVCPIDYVLEFETKNVAEKMALAYAVKAADTAKYLEKLFEQAVSCFEKGDEEGVRKVLREASFQELGYGDDPATQALAEQLLVRSLWED